MTLSPLKIKLKKGEAKMTRVTSRERGKKIWAKTVSANHGRPKDTAPVKRLQCSAQVDPAVDRPHCGESVNEDGVHCNFCSNWDHKNCSDADGTLFVVYKCDICKAKINM